jgi:hypothetical protein
MNIKIIANKLLFKSIKFINNNFLIYLALGMVGVLCAIEPSIAKSYFPEKVQPYEDLAGYSGSQFNGTFQIKIIKNRRMPCDCKNGTQNYRLGIKVLRGQAAFKWLSKRRLARKKNGKWRKTDDYNKWLDRRDQKLLYWQKCPQYCKNKPNNNRTIANRNYWVSNDGSHSFKRNGSGSWTESTADGRSLHFSQVEKANNYIILLDSRRGILVKVTNRSSFWAYNKQGSQWTYIDNGRWK